MLNKSPLAFGLVSLLALVISNTAQADTNALTFPPSESDVVYQYPPQNIGNGSRNPSPTYTFGQANVLPTNTARTTQRNIANNYPRNSRSYPGYPNRGVANPRTTYNPYNNQRRAYPSYPNRNTNSGFPFTNNNFSPFGNSGFNGLNPMTGSFPFSGNSFGMPNNPMNNMFGTNNNRNLPFFKQSTKKRKKAWGDERNIWPDFYTDFTDEAWDTATSGPRDLGRMPGGWRFPYISTPDPVTVSDAIVNQFPPIMEEGGNMADFTDWGMFDNN